MKQIIIAFTLCMCMFFRPLSAQDVSQKIENYLGELESSGFSGSVLVAKEGKVITKTGLGLSDQELNIKNTSETIYTTGSITKQFTGAAILKLQMNGMLNVEDLMSAYIEDVPSDKKNITIHHLLTHSAGFQGAIGRDDDNIKSEEFMNLAMNSNLAFEPGKSYRYSNVGYSILGIIIEKVSGQKYESFLREQLFIPAGMVQTGYVLPSYNISQHAVGYSGDDAWGKIVDKNWDQEGPGWHLKGNGGILSSVEDLYKWDQALRGNKILDPESKKAYYQRHIEEGEGAGTYYGYGWAIFPTPRGTDLITHNGGNGIFFADFLRYIDEDITIITMTNKASRKYEDVAFMLAGCLLVPDFNPELREDSPEGFDEEAAKDIVMEFMEVIKVNDEEEWKKFLVNHTTQEFLNIAPMDFHMEQFKMMHKDIGGSNIIGGQINGATATLELSNNSQLIVSYQVSPDSTLKVEGLRLN